MENHANIFISNIEEETLRNSYYRKVLYTSAHQQIVVQSIKPKSDIEFEIHNDNDQFIRVEKGTGLLLVGPNKESKYELKDGVATIIPAGTWHQVVNTSDTQPLNLYTIYSPPHHPKDKIDMERPDSCKNENKTKTDQFGGYKSEFENFLVEAKKYGFMY